MTSPIWCCFKRADANAEAQEVGGAMVQLAREWILANLKLDRFCVGGGGPKILLTTHGGLEEGELTEKIQYFFRTK